jgi:type IV secretion system protein VirB11
VPKGHQSLTIRVGSDSWPTLPDLNAQGLFKRTRRTRPEPTPDDARLLQHYQNERFSEFLSLAVKTKKSIILCGENAAGKTYVAKALMSEIEMWERLITIQNAPELRGLPHPNHVQLFVDNAASEQGVKPIHLVSAALRMRIGRLFLQELKDGEEVVAYLLAGQTGHSGSITTIHARHCLAVFDRMRVLIKQTPGGAAISDADINSELHEIVDVIAHCSRIDGATEDDTKFAVDEIWYRGAEA